ncbi:MAG: PHP domain-containing protein [Saprospiraceae bacterium]
MTNKEIGELFGELASLMELHGENEFKSRIYANAYLNIKKIDIPLYQKTKEELGQFPQLGKALIEKIIELSSTGEIKDLEAWRAKTPEGVRQMFKIKGVGPKKVRVFWKEMQIESIGELLYACKENRLILYKGFGPKIQEDIIKNIEYFQVNSDSFLLNKLKTEAENLIAALRKLNPEIRFEITGSIRRTMPTVDLIELLSSSQNIQWPAEFELTQTEENMLNGIWNLAYKVKIYLCSEEEFGSQLLQSTDGSQAFKDYISWDTLAAVKEEAELFVVMKKSYVPAECRDLEDYTDFDEKLLIEEADIKGVIHNHSTYSDGIYTLKDMTKECIRLGYQYLVISDHSKSAGYANGLSIERVEMQWREIDQLNQELHPFKIFKSIESDILADGSLDYPEDILAGFDLVIASIHSNLNMDEEKAMTRLIKAIENPYTRILGHLTGRLLLSRRGYPVNHQKIIDACASNNVVPELNANPVRLDIDWTWVPQLQKQNLLLSINPDAHNLKGIQDIKHGVVAARKGGLLKTNCLNAKNLNEFETWLAHK